MEFKADLRDVSFRLHGSCVYIILKRILVVWLVSTSECVHYGSREDTTIDDWRGRLGTLRRQIKTAGDDFSNHMVYFDDKLLGDRIQTGLNRGASGLFWTNYLSLQPLLNIFLFGIGVTLNGRVMLHNLQVLSSLLVVALFFQGDGQGLSAESDVACAKRFERTLLQQVAVGLLSQPVIIFPYLVFAMGLEHRVQYRETRGKRAKRKA